MRRVALVLVVVAVLLAGCSDDGGSSDGDEGTVTTSTAASGATGTDVDEATTTTTITGDPGAVTPLVEMLVPPATFGAGYAPDAIEGDGTFDGDLCDGVTIEATWVDQAGQALRDGSGAGSVVQAVLRFPADDVAAGFVRDLVEGATTCDPNIVPAPVPGTGDEATRLATSDEEGSYDRVVVRVGPLVTTTLALTDGPSPLTDEVVTALGTTLAG